MVQCTVNVSGSHFFHLPILHNTIVDMQASSGGVEPSPLVSNISCSARSGVHLRFLEEQSRIAAVLPPPVRYFHPQPP